MDAQEPHPLGVDPAAVGVALAWVERLREGDIAALWSRTSHDYRLALTQWWVTATPGVCDDPAVAGKSRDIVAEEISTGHHPLFDHLRRDLARDLRTSVADLENLELSAGTAARVVSPGVELIALFVADDIPDGSFAPGATARAVTVAVAQEDGQWLVTGLNCVAVPGVATDMVTSHRKSRGLTWVMPALRSAAVARIVDTNSTLDRPAGDPHRAAAQDVESWGRRLTSGLCPSLQCSL